MAEADDLVPGARRINAIDVYGSCPLPSGEDYEPFWVDTVLYDIPNTLMHAVRGAHSVGSQAVVFPSFLVRMTKYSGVMELCRFLRMTIVIAHSEYDPYLQDIHGTFKRSVHWRPA